MAFTNTVETVGDAALTDSILNRSITELHDDIMTALGLHALRACTALTNVIFKNVASVAIGAFWNCTALTKADFSAAVAFANNAFYGCTSLTALILRSTTLCTISDTPFASSAIASGTGYIYVPAALVDQYKASWTAYAAQIRAIEDYPTICDPYSWTSVAIAIADGTYKDVYKIGDLVPLDMGSEGLINMQIAAFDADDLADGSGKAPISWVSKELLKTTKAFNPSLVTNDDGTYQEGTGIIGGWASSELRTYLSGTIMPMIPDEVRSMIKTVAKSQSYYTTAGTMDTQITNDSVWIPSYDEVRGTDSLYYPLFQNANANRIKYEVGSSVARWWRLRDAFDKTKPYLIDNKGNGSGIYTAAAYGGVALCFCT